MPFGRFDLTWTTGNAATRPGSVGTGVALAIESCSSSRHRLTVPSSDCTSADSSSYVLVCSPSSVVPVSAAVCMSCNMAAVLVARLLSAAAICSLIVMAGSLARRAPESPGKVTAVTPARDFTKRISAPGLLGMVASDSSTISVFFRFSVPVASRSIPSASTRKPIDTLRHQAGFDGVPGFVDRVFERSRRVDNRDRRLKRDAVSGRRIQEHGPDRRVGVMLPE